MFRDKTTNFERAVFFSWYCKLRDCKFCYMSTHKEPEGSTLARRRTESILTEVLITKKLGWDLGFLSGGIGAYKQAEFLDLLDKVFKTWGDKIWISIGPIPNDELMQYRPYVRGVVGSIETVNPKLHDYLCPSKPMGPYLQMYDDAKTLGFKTAITIILGVGETMADFASLQALIRRYSISKIHFYALNPQKGTVFEGKGSPTAEYQAEWIRKTREAFPDMDIQCGIWEDKVDRAGALLTAGADSISKFPALKYFGSAQAAALENNIAQAGFRFSSSLTIMPDVDWDAEIDALPFESQLKGRLKIRVASYLKMMNRQKKAKKNKKEEF